MHDMKTNLESWFSNHAQAIEQGLTIHAGDLVAYANGNRPLPLSDLELCAVVDKRLVPMPPNFFPKQVEVKVGKRRWYTSHFVATNGLEILDYVPGIFFADEIQRISGIAHLTEQAPQLIHVLTKEVTVLYATAEEARKTVGLSYIF